MAQTHSSPPPKNPLTKPPGYDLLRSPRIPFKQHSTQSQVPVGLWQPWKQALQKYTVLSVCQLDTSYAPPLGLILVK